MIDKTIVEPKCDIEELDMSETEPKVVTQRILFFNNIFSSVMVLPGIALVMSWIGWDDNNVSCYWMLLCMFKILNMFLASIYVVTFKHVWGMCFPNNNI